MLYRDDLYHIDLDELRQGNLKVSSGLETEQQTNEELAKDYTELQELLIQRDNEINALKHMLDRKDEEQ